MPCGPALINAVADLLEVEPPSVPLIQAKIRNSRVRRPMRPVITQLIEQRNGMTPAKIKSRLGGKISTRAIRYAISALIASGKARRKGEQGPVYAVVPE